ncbi:hypothetical protein WJX81_007913 [Elliptochloris bilobata]|uniref:HTH HARE-type domain-containing protein n=1 Tax=Elliptochloris bilobata TaxID=381761 RepID=A0AAW1SD84_9CHLO
MLAGGSAAVHALAARPEFVTLLQGLASGVADPATLLRAAAQQQYAAAAAAHAAAAAAAAQRLAAQRAAEREERERARIEERRVAKEEARLRVAADKAAKKAQHAADREAKAGERRRQRDLRKKEKEMAKALAVQERQAMRLHTRDHARGPKDDLDYESEALLAAPAAAADAAAADAACDMDTDAAEASRLCGEVHVALLRLLLADMEEAHAGGALQSWGGSGAGPDRAATAVARMLQEAWAWGFDVSAWRAHLSALTWPEVLRQVTMAAGLGPTRPRQPHGGRRTRPKQGSAGEDTVAGSSGRRSLRVPARFAPGTVKAAAWQVLADAGPGGLPVGEIAERVQTLGLRDMRTSKAPKASVVAALSADLVFARVAPGTYALHSLLQKDTLEADADEGAGAGSGGLLGCGGTPGLAPRHSAPRDAGAGGTREAGAPKAAPRVFRRASSEETESHAGGQGGGDEGGAGGAEDEEEDEEEVASRPGAAPAEARGERGRAWVAALALGGYGALSAGERLAALSDLVHLVLDAPSVRACLDARLEEGLRLRRRKWDDNRVEKRQRQEAAAERARAAADQAAVQLERFRAAERARLAAIAAGGPSRGARGNAGGGGAGNGETSSASPSRRPEGASDFEAGEAGEASMSRQGSQAAPEPDGSGWELGSLARPRKRRRGKSAECDERRAGAAGGETLLAADAAAARNRQRAETIRRMEEAHAVRAEPLGQDRRFNRYWRLLAGGEDGGDPAAGRLLVELAPALDDPDSLENPSYDPAGPAVGAAAAGSGTGPQPGWRSKEGMREAVPERGCGWVEVASGEALEGLMGALDRRGPREGALHTALLRHRDALLRRMPAPPLRFQEAQASGAPLRLWLDTPPLHAAAYAASTTPGSCPDDMDVEAALPREALAADWSAHAWRQGVRGAQGAGDLRAALAQLEAAVQGGFISPLYRRRLHPAAAHAGGAWQHAGGEAGGAAAAACPGAAGAGACRRGGCSVSPASAPGHAGTRRCMRGAAGVACGAGPCCNPDPPGDPANGLVGLPATPAAVALRLAALDAALAYRPGTRPAREVLPAYRFTQRPAAAPASAEGFVEDGCRVVAYPAVAAGGAQALDHREKEVPMQDVL